jgi:hypothetical protein
MSGIAERISDELASHCEEMRGATESTARWIAKQASDPSADERDKAEATRAQAKLRAILAVLAVVALASCADNVPAAGYWTTPPDAGVDSAQDASAAPREGVVDGERPRHHHP